MHAIPPLMRGDLFLFVAEQSYRRRNTLIFRDYACKAAKSEKFIGKNVSRHCLWCHLFMTNQHIQNLKRRYSLNIYYIYINIYIYINCSYLHELHNDHNCEILWFLKVRIYIWSMRTSCIFFHFVSFLGFAFLLLGRLDLAVVSMQTEYLWSRAREAWCSPSAIEEQAKYTGKFFLGMAGNSSIVSFPRYHHTASTWMQSMHHFSNTVTSFMHKYAMSEEGNNSPFYIHYKYIYMYISTSYMYIICYFN